MLEAMKNNLSVSSNSLFEIFVRLIGLWLEYKEYTATQNTFLDTMVTMRLKFDTSWRGEYIKNSINVYKIGNFFEIR